MKQYNFLSTLLGLTLLWAGTGCSQEEEMSMISAVHSDFVITVAQEGMSGVYSRAVTDETYTTNFEEGDEIGLFAVKDGRIKDDFNNVKVSLNDGNWKIADKNLLYEEDKESGTVYFAYYPYNSELSITSVESPDFFKGLVSGWTIPADQSTEENFEAADLMTTLEGVSASQNEKGQYTIPLKLAHRMAMAVIELPSIHYNFKNEDVDLNTVPYITKAAGIKFYKGVIDDNNEIKPFLVDDDSYRLIIKPDEEPNVVGVANSQQYKLQTVVAAGKYKHFEVGGGRVEKEYLLEIGDYYCSDGSLIKPADLTDTNKEHVVGVVYYVGNPQPSALYEDIKNYKGDPVQTVTEHNDILLQSYPGCVHGLVCAITSGKMEVSRFCASSKYKYAEQISTFSLDKTHLFVSAGGSYAPEYLLGYNNTSILQQLAILDTGDPTGESASDDMFKVLNEYEAAYSVPQVTTGWYLPSYGEFKIMSENQQVLDVSLGQEGFEKLWSLPLYEPTDNKTAYAGYWTSVVRGNGTMLGALKDNGTIKAFQEKNTKDGRGYFRFALAF